MLLEWFLGFRIPSFKSLAESFFQFIMIFFSWFFQDSVLTSDFQRIACVWPFLVFILGLHWEYWIDNFVYIIKLGKFGDIISSNIFLNILDSNSMYFQLFDTVWKILSLCIFFFFSAFSLCTLIISSDLYPSSLIFIFSVVSIQFLNSSSSYLSVFYFRYFSSQF